MAWIVRGPGFRAEYESLEEALSRAKEVVAGNGGLSIHLGPRWITVCAADEHRGPGPCVSIVEHS